MLRIRTSPAPVPFVGDFYYDTDERCVYVHDGVGWVKNDVKRQLVFAGFNPAQLLGYMLHHKIEPRYFRAYNLHRFPHIKEGGYRIGGVKISEYGTVDIDILEGREYRRVRAEELYCFLEIIPDGLYRVEIMKDIKPNEAFLIDGKASGMNNMLIRMENAFREVFRGDTWWLPYLIPKPYNYGDALGDGVCFEYGIVVEKESDSVLAAAIAANLLEP